MDSFSNYIEGIDPHKRDAFIKLVDTLSSNLPSGFEPCMLYGMPSFVVPLKTYPKGYHSEKNTPLPFISVAAQKNHIALYHMGIYAVTELLAWFELAYKNQVPTKLDMGKSCIRFKNPNTIPYELISSLAQKISVEAWIQAYEKR